MTDTTGLDASGLSNDSDYTNRIRFTGWLTGADKDVKFQAADIFVFTSLHDTSGMALIEAMANGLAVIVLDCGGPHETVGEAGIRIGVSSAESAERELAAAVQRLCDSSEVRLALGLKALQRITKFGWEAQLRRILEVYQHAVAHFGHPE